jgi:ankyrin repeat protein
VWNDDASAAWWAAEHGVEGTLQHLVAAGADFRWESNFWDYTYRIGTRRVLTGRNLPDDSYDWQDRDYPFGQVKDHPIWHAARHGHVQVVDRLLALGVNINYKGPRGLSPLALAARGGHFDLVRFLVSRGACQLSLDYKGTRPIGNAAAEGHHEIEDFLLQELRRLHYPLDLTIKGQVMAMLNHAVMLRDAARLRHLISQGADLNCQPYPRAYTPLYVAVCCSEVGLVRLLLEHGASPNVTVAINRRRHRWFPCCSPLDACLDNITLSLELLRLLLQYGADAAEYGWNALYGALRRGQLAEFQALVDHGADVVNIRVRDKPLLWYAIKLGRGPFVDILLEKGAPIDREDLRDIRTQGFKDEALLCHVESLMDSDTCLHPDPAPSSPA